jgi:hypothetical protein
LRLQERKLHSQGLKCISSEERKTDFDKKRSYEFRMLGRTEDGAGEGKKEIDLSPVLS